MIKTIEEIYEEGIKQVMFRHGLPRDRIRIMTPD